VYQQAQRQLDPPDAAPLTEDDAIRQLEGLHALREAHFGPDVARRFFGREEAIGREMIEVLRVENDQSLTTQEKLERSQALRERLPGVAAIERNNRQSTQPQEQRQEN
jgi:lipase chaperone LimK